MSEGKKVIDTEIVGDIWVILSTSLVVFIAILWFITEDSYTTVMISSAITTLLILGYIIFSKYRPKKQDLDDTKNVINSKKK